MKQLPLFVLCDEEKCGNLAEWVCNRTHISLAMLHYKWDCDAVRCSEHKEPPNVIFTTHEWEEIEHEDK